MQRWLAVLLVFAVLAVYLWQFSRAVSSVPYWDDYDVVFAFVKSWDSTSTIAEKVSLLWEQHNEHRLYSLRLATLFFITVFSSLALQVQLYLASFSLLAIIHVFLKLSGSGWRSSFAPLLTALAFTPTFDDSALWYTGAVSNFFVISFGICSLHLSLARGRWWLWAFPIALCAPGFQGNGVFVAPLCCFLSLFAAERRVLKVSLWAAASCVIIGAYFTGYHPVPGHCEMNVSVKSIGAYFQYSLAFIGSAFAFENFDVAIGVGGVILIIFFDALRVGMLRKQPAFVGIIAFLLLTVASNCVGRSCFGLEYAVTQPRYRIFGVIFVIAALALIEQSYRFFTKPRIKGALPFACFVVFLSISYSKDPQLLWQRSKLEQGFVRALFSESREGIFFPAPLQAWEYFTYARERGVTHLDQELHDRYRAMPLGADPIEHKERIHHGIASEQRDGDLLVHGWAVPPEECSTSYRLSVILKNDSERREFQVRRLHRQDANDLFKRSPQHVLGFLGIVPLRDMPKGDYRIFVALRGCESSVRKGLENIVAKRPTNISIR